MRVHDVIDVLEAAGDTVGEMKDECADHRAGPSLNAHADENVKYAQRHLADAFNNIENAMSYLQCAVAEIDEEKIKQWVGGDYDQGEEWANKVKDAEANAEAS